MEQLGHNRFLLAGHDRGARVAHRLAIDHPDRVEKLALLDIIPTLEHFERADMAFGLGYYHWFWLAQPHPFPETLINAAPEDWFRAHTAREPKPDGFFNADALADYMAAVRDPEMIRGMCEDYRAAASIDLDHDRASRSAGRQYHLPASRALGRERERSANGMTRCQNLGRLLRRRHHCRRAQTPATISRKKTRKASSTSSAEFFCVAACPFRARTLSFPDTLRSVKAPRMSPTEKPRAWSVG